MNARMRHLRILIVLTALVALLPTTALGQSNLWVTIDPSTMTIAPGGDASFLGTIENQGTVEESLVGISINLLGLDITYDDTPYFTTFPLSVQPGQTVSGTFLTAYAGAGAIPGDYLGSLSVSNENDESSNIAQFTLRLQGEVIPEPAMLQLPALLGLAGAAWWRRRR